MMLLDGQIPRSEIHWKLLTGLQLSELQWTILGQISMFMLLYTPWPSYSFRQNTSKKKKKGMYIILAYLNHRSHEQGPAPWGSVPIIGKAIPPFHPPAWGREREAPVVSISSMMKHVCQSNSVFVHSSTPTTSFASNGGKKECTFFVPLLASNLNFYPYFIQTYHGITMESRSQRQWGTW
jgi:hypothetical protein